MSILESHLELLEREIESRPASSAVESAMVIDDAISVHLALFDVFERRLGSDGLSEEHRPIVSLFQRWLDAERRIVKSAGTASSSPALNPRMHAKTSSMVARGQLADFEFRESGAIVWVTITFLYGSDEKTLFIEDIAVEFAG